MKITEIAIRRPAFLTMIFCALAVIGIWSYSNMGVNLLPNMSFPWVYVTTIYPGAGPNEVETQIAKPLEESLSSINGLKSLRSYSSENVCFTLIEFTMSTDPNNAINDVDRKVNEIKTRLPKEMLEPETGKFDFNSLPILRIALQSNLQGNDFYQFVKNKIKTKIEQIDGISGVTIVGGKEREIRVEVDNNKLKSYNLSITQITQKLQAENLDFPTGKVEEKNKNYTVRVAGKFTNIEDFKNMLIAMTPQGSIYLKDVANVVDTYKNDYSYSRLNGSNGIGLIITKVSDANSVKTSDKVRKLLANLEKDYSSTGFKVTVSQDITTFTKDSLTDVLRDLGLAILMVAFVLFLFLHNFKNTFIVLLSIPTSLVSSFIMMYALGFTINLVTLIALTLVIGILVDDSIVVLENIHRHAEMGEEPREAAIKGRAEIGMAAIAITLVDVVVFLPISFVGGMVGKIFREFGITVVTSTLFSLFVSFTLTPMLASRWIKISEYAKNSFLGRFVRSFDKFENKLSDSYRNILAWSLNHRKTILTISFSFLLLSFTFIPFGLIGTEFMPATDRGEFALKVEMPLGTSVDETNRAVEKLESMIINLDYVDRIYTVVGGSSEDYGTSQKTNISQIQVKLKAKRKINTQDVINDFLEKAHSIPGIKATASLIGLFGAADDTPVFMEIKGQDLDELIKYTEKVSDIITKTKGTRDIITSWEEGQPEVKVIINREKCASMNLTLAEVALTLRNALEGDNTSKFKETDTEYDIRVILSDIDRDKPEDISNITIINRLGQQIKLADVANIYFGKGPSQIQRKDKTRLISVQANLDETRPLNEVLDDINKKIKELNIPPEITIQSIGAAEDMQNMFADMLLAISFAILFVYMIMVSLYESYIYPFIIMFALPVALFGAFAGLFLAGSNLNMFSMIGILMAMGLVTKNAILLVDYTNTLRGRGREMIDALLEAGPIRLRPILMTTSTMIMGMLPLAIGAGGAGSIRRGLAVVVIGALISSTLLTLVLVPVMYTYMEGLSKRMGRFFRKKQISA